MELNWKNIKNYIEEILQLVKDDLNKETFEAIKHYLKYDEYEMAFEILFIEIMKLKKIPKMNYKNNIIIGKYLKLDKDSIFDKNFWNKFLKLNNIRNSKK